MNRRSFFKWLGIGAATAAVAPNILPLVEIKSVRTRGKELRLNFYRMLYEPSSNINDVTYFRVGVDPKRIFRPLIEKLNVNDYVDMTEDEAHKELPERFHAGRYRRIG